MRLSVSRNELYGKLSIVQKVINPKTPLPITENFLFKIEGNILNIVATDLETTLSARARLESSESNIVFAMPTRIMDMLKELPEQIITLNIDEQSFNVTLINESQSFSGDFLGIAVGENGEEFPKPKELSEDRDTLNIPSNTLFNGISKTIFATADDDTRPVMTGVLFDMFDDSINFVSTDAHTLVKHTVKNLNIGFDKSFILPKKPALTLKNILVKTDEDISISFDTKNIVFKMPEFEMICRQIEGRYPNYVTVIPQNPYKAIVDRYTLLNAIKLVKPCANQGTGLVECTIANNTIKISTKDIDFSTSAKEEMVCQYSDEPITIGFRSSSLEEILTNMQDSQIIIALSDPSKAGTIVPFENEENEELLMLFMPLFIN